MLVFTRWRLLAPFVTWGGSRNQLLHLAQLHSRPCQLVTCVASSSAVRVSTSTALPKWRLCNQNCVLPNAARASSLVTAGSQERADLGDKSHTLPSTVRLFAGRLGLPTMSAVGGASTVGNVNRTASRSWCDQIGRAWRRLHPESRQSDRVAIYPADRRIQHTGGSVEPPAS